MVLGKRVAIFNCESWGRNLAPREGQKIPCSVHVSVYGVQGDRN